jgi:hypothetical protein
MPIPTLPIDALAVADLVNAINGIQAGQSVSTPAGDVTYGSTLAAKLYDPDGVSLKEGFAHVIQGDDQPLPKQPLNKDEYYVPVVIVCAAVGSKSPPEGTPSVEDRLRIMNADIRLALGLDVRRGGHAVNTIFVEKSIYDLDSKPPLVAVPLKLHIRTARNNRYLP